MDGRSPKAASTAGLGHCDLEIDLVDIPGGTFTMGTDDPQRWVADREGPARAESVDAFEIGRYAVSVGEFAAFVEATGFETDAERFGWSFVFGPLVPPDTPIVGTVASTPWWCRVDGASWRHPFGPSSSTAGREDHPVVHVSWADAAAFCDWAAVRLPTEIEWERAARGGLERMRYPWGDELAPDGVVMCNIFDGDFPAVDPHAHREIGTVPVDAFAPNGYGLHNVAGNVWEWCASPFTAGRDDRVIRGGSFLCHDSYCDRYRVAARSSNETDASTGHLGFRVARDALRS